MDLGVLIDSNEDIKRSVLLGFRGSVAHGMYVPNTDPNSIDDIDLMAIVIPSLDHYFGMKSFGSRGTKEIKQGEWDVVVYEFKKFVSLLAQGNPNVLSMLWLNSYLDLSDAARLLVENRHLFAAQHVYNSFVGYAHSQLKKMHGSAFQGYMGQRRKQLVVRYGYDTKNAAHLIRLLRMAIEFLNEGELYVDRSGIDAESLLSIKRGEWVMDHVAKEAERLFGLALEAKNSSPLPEKPDLDKISDLCREALEYHFYGSKRY